MCLMEDKQHSLRQAFTAKHFPQHHHAECDGWRTLFPPPPYPASLWTHNSQCTPMQKNTHTHTHTHTHTQAYTESHGLDHLSQSCLYHPSTKSAHTGWMMSPGDEFQSEGHLRESIALDRRAQSCPQSFLLQSMSPNTHAHTDKHTSTVLCKGREGREWQKALIEKERGRVLDCRLTPQLVCADFVESVQIGGGCSQFITHNTGSGDRRGKEGRGENEWRRRSESTVSGDDCNTWAAMFRFETDKSAGCVRRGQSDWTSSLTTATVRPSAGVKM